MPNQPATLPVSGVYALHRKIVGQHVPRDFLAHTFDKLAKVLPQSAQLHVQFIDKEATGAIAKSNFAGLRYREPVYRSLRELAMSYFEHHFNLRGGRSLRTFSHPVNLARIDRLEWMTTEKPVWFVAGYLCMIRHHQVLRPGMAERLHRLDDRLFRTGCTDRQVRKQ